MFCNCRFCFRGYVSSLEAESSIGVVLVPRPYFCVQKVVVKLGVHNDKEKQRAMKATSSLAGLEPRRIALVSVLELTAAEKDGFFSEINMAIAGNHGLEVQFIGLSFLESLSLFGSLDKLVAPDHSCHSLLQDMSKGTSWKNLGQLLVFLLVVHQ
ncbi:unnamed protein product [Lactuca saligna]|uniref:Uncharacterized protein n=1 Tax=Lactuca saligna TaxID=75948 RepID=A0AA35VR18_LACSI|nr:unnamed protein product [Lactuca saligna]